MKKARLIHEPCRRVWVILPPGVGEDLPERLPTRSVMATRSGCGGVCLRLRRLVLVEWQPIGGSLDYEYTILAEWPGSSYSSNDGWSSRQSEGVTRAAKARWWVTRPAALDAYVVEPGQDVTARDLRRGRWLTVCSNVGQRHWDPTDLLVDSVDELPRKAWVTVDIELPPPAKAVYGWRDEAEDKLLDLAIEHGWEL